jgi:hypothetical protein
VIECDFHYAGCEARLPRRNIPDHLKDGLVAHISLLAVSYSQLAESHKRQQVEIQAYQKEIKALHKAHQEETETIRGEVDKLKKQTEHLRLNMQIFPIDFRVENPGRYTVNNPWSSTPFYSHSQGYKLQISFNTLWSISVLHCHLTQGDFDGLLKWPIKAVMKLALVNQQQGRDYEFNIELTCNKPLQDKAVPVTCSSASLGSMNLVPYISSECLHIRIVAIQFQN